MPEEKEADTVRSIGGQSGSVGWPESGQNMPSVLVNLCVIRARL